MAEEHPLQGFVPTFAVPGDTNRVLTANRAKPVLVCDNFSLLFHRYLPREAINADQLTNDGGGAKKTVRVWWFEQILKRFSLDVNDSNASEAFQVVHTATVKRWNARTRGTKKFPMILTSRMIVGLGGKGPLEIGLTIDQITGLPYIPGSALKGVARSYMLYIIADELINRTNPQVLNWDLLKDLNEFYLDDNNKQKNRANVKLEQLDKDIIAGKFADKTPMIALYRLIFGAEDLPAKGGLPKKDGEAGQAVFHDAVLMGAPSVVYGLDVMTPHFKGWYNSGNSSSGKPTEAAHDADSPNPVVFLTVNAGCQFAFSVGWRGAENLEAHRFTKKLLEAALQEFGIGSKTAAGYGAFKPVPVKK